MKNLALLLIACGVGAIVLGVVGFDRDKTVIDIGGLKATATEHKSFPAAPTVGVIAIVGGLALLLVSRRRA